jgi:DUF4097 and DUF4098 domain-containing protein YvlB
MRLIGKIGWLSLLAMAATAVQVEAQGRQGQVATEEKTFSVSGTPTVRTSTFDGHIRIEAADQPSVRCVIEKRGRTQEDIDHIQVDASQDGNIIIVDVKMRTRVRFNSSASANITLTLPRQVNLSARTGDGGIEARDLTGVIELNTGDGKINASNLHGQLNVHTGDGTVELMDVAGQLRAKTGDGGVHIRGRFDALEASTGDGPIDITVERGSTMTGAWAIRTGDGSVQLALPDDFSAELDVHTNDGSINSDLPLTVSGKISGNTLRSRLNQGGATLTVHTGDGSITLRRS